MNFVYHVEGGDFTNAGSTSSQVKRMLKKIGVSPEIVKKTVVALYEAEVNIVAHAYRGDITVDLEEDHIKIVLDDEGPGIPDIDKAMQKGYSTASQKVREMASKPASSNSSATSSFINSAISAKSRMTGHVRRTLCVIPVRIFLVLFCIRIPS